MKIAFLVEEFPSLSNTFILNQITGLIDRGHQVDIYTANQINPPKIHPDIEKYKLLNHTYSAKMPKDLFLRRLKAARLLLANYHKNFIVSLHSLNVFKYRKKASSLRLFYVTIPFLPKQSYDIIHCHFGWSAMDGMILREIGVLQGKLIATFHGVDITQYIHFAGIHAYDSLFASADLLQPISKRWKERLIELGCNEKKIIVHRMGIDCSRFCFHPRQPPADGLVRCVTVCRLVEKKGLEYGIQAIAKLATINPNIEYKIIGDGILKEELQQLVRSLDIDNIVKILDPKDQQEIVEILNNSHIFLAPSVTSQKGDQEGIPVVLMEAMASGLPVVSTQHSGIPELVENGVSGFLVPERDVDALAEKLGYLIEHPEIWAKMGKSGRTYVEEHYNIDKLNDRLVEIYQQLLEGGIG